MTKPVVISRRAESADAKNETPPIRNEAAEAIPAPNAVEPEGPAVVASAPDKVLSQIPADRMADPSFYYEQIAAIAFRLKNEPKFTGTEANKQRTFWVETYKAITDKDLSEAARSQISPLERLEDESLLEKEEGELKRLSEAILAVPTLAPDFRRRWAAAIGLVLLLQTTCRASAIGTWLYTCRDSEKGEIFMPAPIHLSFFETWEHPDAVRGTMIEAPPGHGKTTCLRGWIAHRIGKDPSRRALRLCDKDDKAIKEIRLLKNLIGSKRYQALFPHIEILGRSENQEESARRFTVSRPNWFSREPTMEAAASLSSTQGNGYDDIYADDICKPEVATQPAVREMIDTKWRSEHEERLRDPSTSRVDMIYTPWHPEDTHGRIKREIEQGARPGWKTASFPVKTDADGLPISLWPGRFDSAYYLSKRARLHPQRYARLYEMRCMPDQARIVTKLQFYPSDASDPTWKSLTPELQEAYEHRLREIAAGEQWLSIDPSATGGRASTETAITHFAITPQAKGYIRDAWFFPGNPGLLQKWLVCAIVGKIVYEDEALLAYSLPQVEQVHHILFEAQAGMKGQVTLWREFILNELDRLGIPWKGSLLETGTRGRDGRGQNVGKRIRLINASGYLENGIVRFAGRMEYHANLKRFSFVCSENEAIRKLVDQILNFPLGLSDGVDSVTQWIIWNGPQLDAQEHPEDPIELGGFTDTMQTGMTAALKRLKTPRDDSDAMMTEEAQWTQDRYWS